jgi:hypothetical protein
MRTFKLIVTLIVFLGVSTPNQFFAQELVENTSSLVEDDEIKVEKKKDKKKKEEKIEEVHIDSRFILNAGIDIIVMLIIIGFIYQRNYNKSEILFTFFAFNMVIFLLTYVMNHVKLSMGAAFGLFAIFSMLRYRTEGIAPKDMTYLFIVIAIGMICAIKISLVTLLVICSILIAVVLLFDGNILFKRQFVKPIIYDNVTLIRPAQLPELIVDLKERTGLNIYKVNIVRIDYLKDMALIDVYYHA